MVGWGGWYEGKKSGVIGPKKKMMMMKDVTHLLTMPHAAGKKLMLLYGSPFMCPGGSAIPLG